MPSLCLNIQAVRASKCWLVALISMSLFGCSSPSSITSSQNTNPRLALAAAYYQNGQLHIALEESRKVLEASANDPQALGLQGLIYMRLDEPALAQKSFSLAEMAAPLDPDIAHNHAVFLCEQGKYKDAFGRFESALNLPLYSEKAKTMWVWGVCSNKSGDFLSAQTLWAQSLSKKPNAETALALALSYKHHNDYRAAEVLSQFNRLDVASAETLWLGAQWARQSSDFVALKRYATLLRQRFPNSSQWDAFQREAFDD